MTFAHKTKQEFHEAPGNITEPGKSRIIQDHLLTREKLMHLNALLRSIRNVSQIIKRETDSGRLIRDVCEQLSQTRSYFSIWIALLDKNGRLIDSAEAGEGSNHAEIFDCLRKNKTVYCVKQALDAGRGVILNEPARECIGCPLSKWYAGHGVMMAVIRSGDEVYGVLSIAVPSQFAGDEEEMKLLGEVADDIGLALHNIESEHNRLQLKAQLLQAQKLESIGTLAGGVAHEINNPVNGIMNYAQLILDKLGPDHEISRYAGEISRETERVSMIVKNLLSFARNEKQSHSKARMHDIVESTLSLVRAVLRHDQIVLEIDVPGDLPEIKCRSQQIQQVLMNLITNARDALNDRYPGYDDNKKISVIASVFDKKGHKWIRTTVADTGSGISEEISDRIFDPFFTTKIGDKGTGLGLSISHGIIREHKGELGVESKTGEGTRFHIDLPVDNDWNLDEKVASFRK